MVAKALRARNAGFRIMIDFHYSDSWADPGKQTKPAAWRTHTFDQLMADVYSHTFNTMNTLAANGIFPEWVQVGNETNNGMLWEDGRASVNMRNYAWLVNSGYDAVKAVSPSRKVIVHISNGYDNALFRWNFDGLRSNGGTLGHHRHVAVSRAWQLADAKSIRRSRTSTTCARATARA